MSKEPTRRELKAAIDENSAGIAKNSEAITKNGEAIAGNRTSIDRLERKLDRQSATIESMFEAVKAGFADLTDEVRSIREELQDHNRKLNLLVDGQNENRYRLDGHDSEFSAVKSRVTELEHKAS